jgi:hypothetical protein
MDQYKQVNRFNDSKTPYELVISDVGRKCKRAGTFLEKGTQNISLTPLA